MAHVVAAAAVKKGRRSWGWSVSGMRELKERELRVKEEEMEREKGMMRMLMMMKGSSMVGWWYNEMDHPTHHDANKRKEQKEEQRPMK